VQCARYDPVVPPYLRSYMSTIISTNGAAYSALSQSNVQPVVADCRDGIINGIATHMVDCMTVSGSNVICEYFNVDLHDLSRQLGKNSSNPGFMIAIKQGVQLAWDTYAAMAFKQGRLGELRVKSLVDITHIERARNKPDMIHVIVTRVA
jgi:hypothetical protein